MAFNEQDTKELVENGKKAGAAAIRIGGSILTDILVPMFKTGAQIAQSAGAKMKEVRA